MVTFNRHSDSIDKLTSLVSKMNVMIDRKETPYKPRVYQNRPRGQSKGRQQSFQACNRSFSRDRNRNRGNYNYNRNNRPNYRDRSRTITDVPTDEITTCPMRDVKPIDRTIGGETAIDRTTEIDKIIE